MQEAVEQRAREQEAYEAFADAVRGFDRVLEGLPDLGVVERKTELDAAFTLVRRAHSAVTIRGASDVVVLADDVYAQCAGMERWALRAAAVRSALRALERQWCPGTEGRCEGDPERCTYDPHNSAIVAHAMVESWGGRDELDQAEDRSLLEFCLEESGALSEEQLVALRQELNRASSWDLLLGYGRRRPAGRLREALAAFVSGSRREPSVA
ncbi:hypothetical protein [Streptomyces sp. NPDC014733]|uniref:hypothetical protein n=1 Tax=Streptomyces sp. NPDC014733 TaxID=3364885 RepID=UPI0036F8F4AC